MSQLRRPRRIPGHRLTIEKSGENPRGPEASCTAVCDCGWEESHSTQAGAREEYTWHLDAVFSGLVRRGEASPL